MATRRVSRSRSATRKTRKSMSPKRKSASPKRKSMSPKRKSMRRSTRRTRSASRKSMRRSTRRTRRSTRTRKTRKVGARSAYSNFLKVNMKKLSMQNPNMTFAEKSRMIAKMWRSASAKTKSAVRKMVRSPRKVRKMRMSKRRALKKSGSPRRTRKDKGKKRSSAKLSEWSKFYAKYAGVKKAALGTKDQRMVMKALAADWRAGVRSY